MDGSGGTPSPTSLELLKNPGFELSSDGGSWTATSGVVSNDTQQPAHGGNWMAWLDGYGRATVDRLQQTVTLPAGATSATLSFWLHIDTDETSVTIAYDKLTVQLLDDGGHALATPATFSNLDAASGYKQLKFDISAYRGRTVSLQFVGTEDKAKITSFVLDDVGVWSQ